MLVSVCLITYNHQAFIKQALDSILTQETDFDIEIVIGEDCSKDDTYKILTEYASKNPAMINLLPNHSNLGVMQNFLRTYKSCKGDYIAFIEGDDYWTDSKKLQKQVNFLKDNPTYSACFHNVVIKSERNNESKSWTMHESLSKDVFTTEDILGPWFIASPSFVFVNYKDLMLPDWFEHCKYGDLPLMLLLSLRGKFKYIDDIMAVYRLHDNGLTTKHLGYDKIIVMLFIYGNFNVYSNYAYKEEIRSAMIYEMERHIPKNEVGTIKSNSFEHLLKKIKRIF